MSPIASIASGDGPTQASPASATAPGEAGVLGQEAVPGVDGLRAADLRRLEHPGDVQVDCAPGAGPSSTASSAEPHVQPPASASEWTATALIPSRWQVRMTRTAISPRLATSTVSNTPAPPDVDGDDRDPIRTAGLPAGRTGEPGPVGPVLSTRYSTTVVSTTTSRSRPSTLARSACGARSPPQHRATSARTSCSMPYFRRQGEHSSRWSRIRSCRSRGDLAVEVEEHLGEHLAAVRPVRLAAAHDASSSAALARTRPRSRA